MRGDQERQAHSQADALDRAWDVLVDRGVAQDPPADASPPDPALLAAVRDLHARNAALDPDPTFLPTLRENLMQTHPAASPRTPFAPSFTPTANGHAPTAWLPPHPVPRPARSRPWTRAVELASVAALILAIVGGTLAGTGDLPAFLALWQDAGPDPDPGVPMLGANPARTGEQPGPGPEGEPGLLWRTYVGQAQASAAVVDGTVFLSGNRLYALDVTTGRERWRAEVWNAKAAPAVADGVLYLSDVLNAESSESTGYLRAIDAATGRERWHALTGGSYSSSPAVADGVVYVAGGNTDLFAFDAATGEERWRFSLGPTGCLCAPFSPAVADGFVVVADDGGTLHALAAATGEERWQADVAATEELFVMPTVADGAVYATGGDGNLHVFDLQTGARRAQHAFELTSPPAVVDGVIYAAGGGLLYAIDAASGGERWSAEVGGPPPVTPRRYVPATYAAPVVANGTVYVGSPDGALAAFDAATGAKEWRVDAGSAVLASPAVVGGVLYAGTWDGLLYAIGGTSGEQGAIAAAPIGDQDITGRRPCEAEARPDPVVAGLQGTPRAGLGMLGRPGETTFLDLTEDHLPAGDTAPATAVAGIETTLAALAACSDATASRLYGFFSDDYFRRFAAEVEGDPTGENALHQWETSPFANLVVHDARVLPDGRVGVIAEGGFNPGFLVFVEEGGRWLIDEVILLPIRPPGETLGTPTA